MGEDADRLISNTFAFADAADALPYWDANRGSVLKIVVELPA